MRTNLIVCAVLAMATLVVFWPVGHHAFINYDDMEIYENPQIIHPHPLGENLTWAFTSTEHANWFPLTRLSWLADWQLFRDYAGGHHLMSLAIHAASGLILFLTLAWMTGRRWPSAAVAALFLLHPLHVESVAWAAERKDVLCGLFWMVTLAAYTYYVRRPSLGRYALVFASLAFALMAKPMAVTLPLVLLLLDWWPLGRLGRAASPWQPLEARPSEQPQAGENRGRSRRRAAARRAESSPDVARNLSQDSPAVSFWSGAPQLVLEKLPLLALVAASSVATFFVQKQGGAVASAGAVNLSESIANAIQSYGLYLLKTIWPVDLSILYSYPDIRPVWPAIVAGGVLLLLTAAVVVLARLGRGDTAQRPYLLVGWLWYLGTLVPVIGLIQVGSTTMADRYTYLPLIGIFLAMAWGAVDLAGALRLPRGSVGIAGVAVIGACMILTRIQVGTWADSETVFTHAISAAPGNWLAHDNLGVYLASKGRPDEAEIQYRKAIAIHRDRGDAHCNLANVLFPKKTPEAISEAVREYIEAIACDRNNAEAHCNLGVVLASTARSPEQIDAAIHQYEEAIAINLGYAAAHVNLANALGRRGRAEESIHHYEVAISLRPDLPEAHHNLAAALAGQGRTGDAILQYREALRLRPGWPLPLNDLARLLATAADPSLRDGAEAVRLSREACQATQGTVPRFLDTLGEAYAEAGNFTLAPEAAREAIRTGSAQGLPPQEIAEMQGRLELYRAGQAHHEQPRHP